MDKEQLLASIPRWRRHKPLGKSEDAKPEDNAVLNFDMVDVNDSVFASLIEEAYVKYNPLKLQELPRLLEEYANLPGGLKNMYIKVLKKYYVVPG